MNTFASSVNSMSDDHTLVVLKPAVAQKRPLPRTSLLRRFWQYQKERFPFFSHGLLIASFSFCGVALSATLRGWQPAPNFGAFLAAFITAFLFFLQLRICDEHKDADDDAEFRSYRPVPRGLISLSELSTIGAWAAWLQFVVVLAFCPLLLAPLFLVWTYLWLMTKEFFVGSWLRKHPVLYAASHMLIIPLIDLFTTACDWLPVCTLEKFALQPGLIGFLVVSYCNGIVIEIGRKIRYREEEEPGVETYSVLWGAARAAGVWFYAICLTAVFATITACWTGVAVVEACLLCAFLSGAAIVAGSFQIGANACCPGHSRDVWRPNAKLFETLSGVWTIAMYLSLGGLPLVQHLIHTLRSSP